jgi:cancer susceptibility candidate protein 1
MAISSDRVLVRIKENLEFDLEFAEDQEKDWKSVVFWDNKCACIKAKDSAETLNDHFLEDTEVIFFSFIRIKLTRLILT